MDQVLAGLSFVRFYVDDVIIFRSTPQEHMRHLQVVFEWLHKWGFCSTPWEVQMATAYHPLKWLVELEKLIGKLAILAFLLQKYNFEVVHKACTSN